MNSNIDFNLSLFLKELSYFKKIISSSIYENSSQMNCTAIHIAAQKLINRLVFIRFLEDREVSNYPLLRDLCNLEEDIYPNLLKYFKYIKDMYNTDLFHVKQYIDISLENSILIEVITYLCSYNFNSIPIDVLGSMYEVFLSEKIGINYENKVFIDTSPKIIKENGVFYTPKCIVDYMIANTLDKYLENKCPEDIKSLSIVDPSCGCGSFLVGVYNYLLDWYLKKQSNTKLTLKQRNTILTNHIYGVDLDNVAIEFSKLSLLLKLLEDIVYNDINFHNISSLENNIKYGNSIIFNKYMDNGFVIDYERDKQYQIECFNWEHSFSEVFKNGGFDIVIGNPPYGAKISDELKATYKSMYETTKTIKNVQKGMFDTYNLFIEKGCNLLKKDGICSFIVPMSVVSASSASGIHRFLERSCNFISVSSYAAVPQPIFYNALVNLSIITFIKTNTSNTQILCTQMYRKTKDISVEYIVNNLEFIDTKGLFLEGRYPKISTPLEKSILVKLMNHKLKVANIEQTINGAPIYYRSSGGRYFKIFTNYTTCSVAEKKLNIQKELQNFIGAAFSTSLFFWWYQIFGDNRNLTKDIIYPFPVPNLDLLTHEYLKRVDTLYEEYLYNIEKNSYISAAGTKTYKIVKSKSLINELDDLISPLYGLSKTEIEFIKNYELPFRMNGLNTK